MKLTQTEMIEQAVKESNLTNYTGEFKQLGGGELNNTYLLELANGQAILRIAKHTDQNSLFSEAGALKSLNLPNQVPKLKYFNEDSKINGSAWILEDFINGKTIERLSVRQFYNLGKLLAQIHKSNTESAELQLWPKFLEACQAFGDEYFLLNHPDNQLKLLIVIAHQDLFPEFQPKLSNIKLTLIHGDATPSNVLMDGDSVGLIDWELSSISDPMAEFSTIYYEDIDYNKGKWRLKITPDEKSELFNGYESVGGEIDEERVKFWICFDKLGAAVFLYWRIHESGREADSKQLEQYQADYLSIINSLEQQLLS
jgi:Ser/Thr protein kinase RdoA (MazF antagonist)